MNKQCNKFTNNPSGRGIVPCPFGVYQNNYKIYSSPIVSDLSRLFFEPSQPNWIPPQGNPRPLTRIGNTYRN